MAEEAVMTDAQKDARIKELEDYCYKRAMGGLMNLSFIIKLAANGFMLDYCENLFRGKEFPRTDYVFTSKKALLEFVTSTIEKIEHPVK